MGFWHWLFVWWATGILSVALFFALEIYSEREGVTVGDVAKALALGLLGVVAFIWTLLYVLNRFDVVRRVWAFRLYPRGGRP